MFQRGGEHRRLVSYPGSDLAPSSAGAFRLGFYPLPPLSRFPPRFLAVYYLVNGFHKSTELNPVLVLGFGVNGDCFDGLHESSAPRFNQ